ncbi:MAG: cell division protein FtsQ/DivIB [Succinivibrio sp.]
MAVKKSAPKHFLLGLIFSVLVIGAIIKGSFWLIDYIAQSKSMPVRAVLVEGVFRQLSKKEIADVTGRICGGQNIASLDTIELIKEIKKEPWVAQVSVSKKLPDTLVVSVIEHVPAAYWNENGLYDARTRSVFYPDLSQFSQPLVKLGAFRDSLCNEVYDAAVSFIKVMSNSNYQMVELYLDNVRCFSITLDNGTKLILGRGIDKANERLQRFLSAFAYADLDINDVEYVDLRYDVGFAVGKRKESKEQTIKGRNN